MTREPANLIAGYLDVKLPARSRRRRFGGPWKSWRRHWVAARAGPGGVELTLSAARPESGESRGPEAAVLRLVRLPGMGGSTDARLCANASVCRTTSRSRGHAFAVAAVPEHQQPEAELGGEVFLATRSEADTERWMAVLRTALETHDAPDPTERLSATAARAALMRGRRLSRSEGDLLADSLADDGPGLLPAPACPGCGPGPRAAGTLGRPGRVAQTRQPFRLLYGCSRRRAETLRVDAAERLSTSPQSPSGSSLSLFGGKIASGLLSAGLGLILSTPGGSETEDNDADQDEDCDEVGVVANAVTCMALDRRRESAVSVASGIYEEIAETIDTPAGTPTVIVERVYENASLATARRTSSVYEDPIILLAASARTSQDEVDSLEGQEAMPPPLPPRQNLTPISELLTRAGDCDDGSVDSNGYVQMGRVRLHAGLQTIKCHKQVPLRKNVDTEPTYLPMSPIRPIFLENHQSNT